MSIDDPWEDEPDYYEPYKVICARCGKHGTSDTFIVEEGDEWECGQCWERCEAQERASQSEAHDKP